jgi:hypothetical protein
MFQFSELSFGRHPQFAISAAPDRSLLLAAFGPSFAQDKRCVRDDMDQVRPGNQTENAKFFSEDYAVEFGCEIAE